MAAELTLNIARCRTLLRNNPKLIDIILYLNHYRKESGIRFVVPLLHFPTSQSGLS
jgi:hypothetical protein